LIADRQFDAAEKSRQRRGAGRGGQERGCAYAPLQSSFLSSFLISMSKAFHKKVERTPPKKKHFPLDFLIALSPVSLHKEYGK
jgi:hypothetical protein